MRPTQRLVLRFTLPDNAPAAFALGLALPVLAALARTLLTAAVAEPLLRFATFYAAVLITAFLGGLWPGLLAVLVSTLIGWFLLIPPANSFAIENLGDAANIALFAGIAVVMVLPMHLMRRAARALELQNLALEEEQRKTQFLMRELNHRIKNNLRLVSNLLNLQALAMNDPARNWILVQASARVRAISRLQDRLYASSDPQHVHFKAYIEDLCRELGDDRESGSSSIECAVICDDVQLPPDEAMSLGIIVTELVTNAFQHAYAGRSGGTVHVRCRLDDDRTLHLSVADEGAGLPWSIDPEHTCGPGLRIVARLVSDLGGTMNIVRKAPGTEFLIAVRTLAGTEQMLRRPLGAE